MDSNYIIKRLKTSIYKYPTAQVLQMRLKNLDEGRRSEIMGDLKAELHRQRNVDIHEPLFELLYRPMAS